jgi:hypothetical protein
MITKHENISVGVYWDVVSVPGRKLSACEKYSRSALDIYVATETGGQMRAVGYYSARLRKSDRERARDIRRDAQILKRFFRE